MSVLALWSPIDAVLGIVGPLGAAASVGTALVIDLDPAGPRFGGPFSLADLVEQGPSRNQLEPADSGPAVLRNGGIDAAAAAEVVGELIRRWPNVVLRCPPVAGGPEGATALLPLLPPPFTPSVEGSAVYQRTGFGTRTPTGHMTLPVPRAGTVRALLEGRRPSARDRWLKAFRQVWEQ